jgi:hypothetical protein
MMRDWLQGQFGPTLPMADDRIVKALAFVASENPEAVRLAAQLLGVPACPKCDYVMRDGEFHFCRAEAPHV